MKRIEERLEVISISNDGDDDDRHEVLVRLAKDLAADPIASTSKTRATASTSLFDANAHNQSISIPLKSIQKDKQQQQQRPNKLSRSRPPANQPKTNTSNHTEISLMALDALALKPHESYARRHRDSMPSTTTPFAPSATACSSSSYANTALTLAQSVPSTSYAHAGTNGGTSTTPFIAALQNPPRHPAVASTSGQAHAPGSARHIQDGTTKVTAVQPAATSAAATSNSFEPELVLSPANLGQ